jgi:hypothetical protein
VRALHQKRATRIRAPVVKEILVPLALDDLRQHNRDRTTRVASFDLQDVILSNSFDDEMNRIFRK